MIDTMKITVMTPTLTPRMVNDERSLLARNVSSAITADSLMSSSRILKAESPAHINQNHWSVIIRHFSIIIFLAQGWLTAPYEDESSRDEMPSAK
jgi:hypothetical protein